MPSVAEPKLTRKQVKRIKRRIVAKEPLRPLALEHGVAYMTIYKIAVGLTWKTVKPRGRLIGKRDYATSRSLSPARCEAIALLKIRKRLSNAKIARKLGVSEATVRRGAENGYSMLALRLHRHMVRGTLKPAQLKMQLTDDEVDDLLHEAKKKKLPDWVRKAVAGDEEE